MSNTIIITEAQFKRLFETKEINSGSSILNKLSKCVISEDRKYVSYLGKNYDNKTGEELLINEQGIAGVKALGTGGKIAASDDGWSFSDIAHTVVDVASAGVDFIHPGAGAAIDAAHAISYIIEAQMYKNDKEKRDTLYLLALITGAFAVVPYAFQLYSPVIKNLVKTGTVPAKQTGIMAKLLNKLKSVIPRIIKWFRDKVEWLLNTSLGKKLINKNVDEVLKSIDEFSKNIGNVLTKKTSDARKFVSKTKDKITGKIVSDPKLLKLADAGNMEQLVKQGKFWDGKNIIKLVDEKTGELSADVITALQKNKDLAGKYLDDIVFNVNTGKGYPISSELGQKAIAYNTKHLSKKLKNYNFGKTGSSGFYKIPEKFQAHIKGMMAKNKKDTFKAASSWSKKTITKKVGVSAAETLTSNFKKSREIIGKYMTGSSKLSGEEKKILKALHNATPIASTKNLWKNVKTIVSFSKKINGKQRGAALAKAVMNGIIFNEYITFINRQFCMSGIRTKYSEDSIKPLLLGLDKMIQSPDVYKDDLPGGDFLDGLVWFLSLFPWALDGVLSFLFLRDCSDKGFVNNVANSIPDFLPYSSSAKEMLRKMQSSGDKSLLDGVNIDKAISIGKGASQDDNSQNSSRFVKAKNKDNGGS